MSTDALELVPLDGQGAHTLRRFEAVSRRLYREHPQWVGPLDKEVRAVLGSRNPFWEHATLRLWIARRGGQDVGRIAGIRDESFVRHHGAATLFGWFACEDDPALAQLLFSAVEDWARETGDDRILGPFQPSVNEEAGLLVEGFGDPPTVLTTWNPPACPALVEGAGLRKVKDLIGFEFRLGDAPLARLGRLAERFRRRHPELEVRPVTKRTVDGDLAGIRALYNQAWEGNWGAVPFTARELDYLVERLLPLLVDGLVWVARQGDDARAVLLAVPDANEILRPLRGNLCSPGLLSALPYLVGLRRPRRVRVIALGVDERLRGRGVEAVMFAGGLDRAHSLGYEVAEASWILENNDPMLRLMESFGGVRSKRWRIYGRELAGESPSKRR